MTYVFTRDLPSWLFLVELLSDTGWNTDDNVRLDGSERSDSGSSWLGSEGSDGGSERSIEGSVTIVSEFSCLSAYYPLKLVKRLTVVEISLEDDQVGLGQVLEEIGCLRVQVPEGVSSAPEGVGLVPPLALLLVLLPSVTEGSERVPLGLGSILKELSVDTRVEDPAHQYLFGGGKLCTYQSQSRLVTSETNQGIFFPWKMT